ncbi:MAG: hypothetical protein ABSA34_03310 [Candidatus Goldiibacteriota bacterium]
MKKIMRAIFAAAWLVFPFAIFSDTPNFYPSAPGMSWHYAGRWKQGDMQKVSVDASISSVKTINSLQYMYYTAPSVDVRFMVRIDGKGAYMKLVKYPFPVLKFLTVDVYMTPEIQFLKFPLFEGETWSQELKATADLVPFKLDRRIKVKFTVVAKEKFSYKGKTLDCYHVKMERDEGQGALRVEDNWFAQDIGFVRGETPEYFIELDGYNPAPAAAK